MRDKIKSVHKVFSPWFKLPAELAGFQGTSFLLETMSNFNIFLK